MNKCSDCRHLHKSRFGPGLNRCKETSEYITIERNPVFVDITRCGVEGKLWEPRRPWWKRLLGFIAE